MWTEIWTFLTPIPPLWTTLLNKAYVVTWTFGKPPSPCHVHMVYDWPLKRLKVIRNCHSYFNVSMYIMYMNGESIYYLSFLTGLPLYRCILISYAIKINYDTDYRCTFSETFSYFFMLTYIFVCSKRLKSFKNLVLFKACHIVSKTTPYCMR